MAEHEKIDHKSTEPLLVKIRDDCDDIENEVKRSIGGKWHSHGLVRNKRNCDDSLKIPSLTVSLLAVTHHKRRLLVLAGLAIILIYVNTTAVGWNDERNTDRIVINHQSHVPGMKENQTTIKIMNVRPTLAITLDIAGISHRVTNSNSNRSSLELTNNSLTHIIPSGYLVWSEQCKMPNLDPFAGDVMKFFKRQKYETCSKVKPLTRITYDSNRKRYVIHIEEHLKRKYAKAGSIECCYQRILRTGSDKKADAEFSLNECENISKSEQDLPRNFDNIIVKCTNLGKEVYIDAYAMTPERKHIRKRLNKWKDETPIDTRPLNVLLVGVDSVSRQNFIRAMPKTAQFVYDTEWFEMSGYNKIEDNTFPNLMAIFTGYNLINANLKCNPYRVGYLDKCPIIWYDFQRSGYVTAYAEDEADISTFNYMKVGFVKQPTDYYLRPFLLAAESQLPKKKKSQMTFCLGYKHSAEYVYDYMLDFATTYQNDSYFGMFWTNTFSHNAISDVSSLDERMLEYMHRFRKTGILENSMIIFFSDHGMRYGPTRQLPSGRLEERLPFFFIWLPDWFKKRYPEFVNALNINKNRLTTPYDVHFTLKHVLELSGRGKLPPRNSDCPKCQSLFLPVPYNRSCADASIEEHWCTCLDYVEINRSSENVQKAAESVVSYMNNFLKNYKNGTLTKSCAKLHVSHIKYAYYVKLVSGSLDAYQVSFETKPGGALFEATVHHNLTSEKFQLAGTVSRLNSYAAMTHCVFEGVLQKFCFCT